MTKRDGHQQGPQDHAEGAHGSKTHQAFIQQLHSKANAPIADEPPSARESKTEKHGSQRRLAQDRQQHDEAEKNSEKTRLSREMDRGNIENDPDEPMSRGTS